MRVSKLKRPISRRLGDMVITITTEGITLRRYRAKRKRKLVTWQQIASLTSKDELVAAGEHYDGIRALMALGIGTIHTEPSQPSEEPKP